MTRGALLGPDDRAVVGGPASSGRPSPVGGIEMSQAASASSFTGSPSPGPAGAADAVISKSVATATAAPVSDIDIADLPLSFTCQVWIAL